MFFVKISGMIMKCANLFPLSFSSQAMGALIEWRNPLGNELNWLQSDAQPIGNIWKHRAKVLSAQIGIAILTVASIVESVALVIFLGNLMFIGVSTSVGMRLLSKSKYPTGVFKRIDKFLAINAHSVIMRLESALKTIKWGISAAVLNLTRLHLYTHENLVMFYQFEHPKRHEIAYVDALATQIRRSQPDYEVWRSSTIPIDHGSRLIVDYVLTGGDETLERIKEIRERLLEKSLNDQDQNLRFELWLKDSCSFSPSDRVWWDYYCHPPAEKLGRFKDCDPALMTDLLKATVFSYVLGSNGDEEVPLFFKDYTRQAIGILRTRRMKYVEPVETELEPMPQNEWSQAVGKVSDALFSTQKFGWPGWYRSPKWDKTAFFFRQTINLTASKELQSSFFITECWCRASEEIARFENIKDELKRLSRS